jgi:predicted metal-dependent peptidase
MDLMKRLSKAKTGLILEHPFIGSVAINMPFELDEATETAATNGKRIKFNPKFIEGLTDEELKFLVAHECLHPMLEHNYRRNGRSPMRWNKACDYVINHLLDQEKIGKFIQGGCLDPNIYNAGNGTSDGIFNILPEDGGNGGGDGPGGAGNDLEDGEGSPAEQQQEAAEWKVKVAQAAQAAKMMGKLSANMQRFVNEVLQPKVDWRDVLRRFVQKAKTDQRTFARPNRRFLSQGLYLPSVSGEVLGEIVIAVDCSGSIGEREINEFATEVKTLKEDGNPAALHIIYFDSEVSHYEYFGRDDEVHVEPHGGGGTAFSPIFRYVNDNGINPVACIVLTDLCCDDFGDMPDYPVLWVSNHSDKAPWGEVVKM